MDLNLHFCIPTPYRIIVLKIPSGNVYTQRKQRNKQRKTINIWLNKTERFLSMSQWHFQVCSQPHGKSSYPVWGVWISFALVGSCCWNSLSRFPGNQVWNCLNLLSRQKWEILLVAIMRTIILVPWYQCMCQLFLRTFFPGKTSHQIYQTPELLPHRWRDEMANHLCEGWVSEASWAIWNNSVLYMYCVLICISLFLHIVPSKFEERFCKINYICIF